MISTKNNSAQWRETYLTVLEKSISIIRKIGYVPVVLNHEGAADAEICDELVRNSHDELKVVKEDCPLRVKRLIGDSAGVICSRFHGCVSALSQGVPCLGTSWSHKYEQLFAEYEQDSFLLNPDVDEFDLERKIRHALGQTEVEKSRSTQLIIEKKNESRKMWDTVFDVIED